MPHYICSNPFLGLKEGIEVLMYHSESPRYFSCIRRLDLTSSLPVVAELGPNFGVIHIAPDKQSRLYFIIVDDNLNRATAQKLQKKLQEQAQFYIDQYVYEHYKESEDKGSWLLLRDYNRFTPGL